MITLWYIFNPKWKARLFHKYISLCLIRWSDFLFQQWLVTWNYGVSIDFMVHVSEKKKRMNILLNETSPINHPSYKKTPHFLYTEKNPKDS